MWAERALDAWSVLERDAIRKRLGRIHVLDGPSGRRAPLWPFAHVLWAAGEIRGLGGDPPIGELLEGLDDFRSGGAYAATPRGQRFFDDNAWLGLAMLRVGVAIADPAWGGRAAEVGRFVRTGEDPEGGVRWAEGSRSRNTCSTASGAWLLLASDGAEHAIAGRWVDWLNATLRNERSLYADHIEDGVVEERLWTYNQGAALAASRLLGRSTAGLRSAILKEWPADRLWAEPPAFAAIAYRALLEDSDERDDVRSVWDPYLERLVAHGRDEHSGWYVAGGVGSYDGRPTIDQAAIAQMLALRSAVDQ